MRVLRCHPEAARDGVRMALCFSLRLDWAPQTQPWQPGTQYLLASAVDDLRAEAIFLADAVAEA